MLGALTAWSQDLRRQRGSTAGGHATLPLAVLIGLLLFSVATTFSHAPLGPTGGTTGNGNGPLLAAAGAVGAGPGGEGSDAAPADDASTNAMGDESLGGQESRTSRAALGSGLSRGDPEALELLAEPGSEALLPAVSGPYFDDGTLMKPSLVDTSLSDGRILLKTYRVRSGDTLTGIAHRFGVSMMTLWWANHLHAKDELHIGQTLTIPPVNGLVLTVKAGDTLETIASQYHVDADEVYDMNKLEDRALVVGQTLILPGASGAGIREPKPTSHPTTTSSSTTRTVRQPTRYSGGSMRWPVVGGNNYISQYFHYGHYAIDIAADYGTTVVAAAGGTVTFAGWKNNGGGYQVWISHGSGLYTTYNHMSAVTVGRGQSVGRGQQVGRIGQSGNATGPHLHFEVWRGPVWAGGTRVNPLLYL